jgi:hypothetical protein
MQYIINAIMGNIIDNILYTILYIYFDKLITCTIMHVLYCRYAFIRGYRKKRWTRRACGRVPEIASNISKLLCVYMPLSRPQIPQFMHSLPRFR